MHRVVGLLVTALVILAVIWLYNHFSGSSVAALGARPTSSAT